MRGRYATERAVNAMGIVIVVCTENSNPDVVVMESADDGERFDAPSPLNRARDRRIFIQ